LIFTALAVLKIYMAPTDVVTRVSLY